MQIDSETLEVTHNKEENRFEVWIENQLSKLDYMLNGNTIVMMHVGVYPEHRGQGVAGRLTRIALEYARRESLRVVPMCSYVAAYIRSHTQYAELTKQRMDE